MDDGRVGVKYFEVQTKDVGKYNGENNGYEH